MPALYSFGTGFAQRIVDQQIANNKRILDDRIQTGHLAEAVEARKDATFLAKQKLDIEMEHI